MTPASAPGTLCLRLQRGPKVLRWGWTAGEGRTRWGERGWRGVDVTSAPGWRMSKATILGLVAVVAVSLWVGFQIDPHRDWLAWIFIIAIPFVVVGGVVWHLMSGKEGERK